MQGVIAVISVLKSFNSFYFLCEKTVGEGITIVVLLLFGRPNKRCMDKEGSIVNNSVIY